MEIRSTHLQKMATCRLKHAWSGDDPRGGDSLSTTKATESLMGTSRTLQSPAGTAKLITVRTELAILEYARELRDNYVAFVNAPWLGSLDDA